LGLTFKEVVNYREKGSCFAEDFAYVGRFTANLSKSAFRISCSASIPNLSLTCVVHRSVLVRMLGRYWCADDVAEATGMGESTVRRAFNSFCDNFVTEFYETVVYRPEGLKLSKMMDVYKRMGLPGCIGATDCVHVKGDRCPVRLYHLCKGEEGYPSLAYSCTVDHHRRILGITQSNFGTRND
jgi:Plant transposon protein